MPVVTLPGIPPITLDLLTTIVATIVMLITLALFMIVGSFLSLKALLLERRSDLGRALARSNVAMSVAYFSSFFGHWVPIFRHPVFRLAVTLAVAVTAFQAIKEFARVYGGWRGVAVEAIEAIAEMIVDIRRATSSCCTSMCSFYSAILEHFRRSYKVYIVLLVVLGVLGALGALGALERF